MAPTKSADVTELDCESAPAAGRPLLLMTPKGRRSQPEDTGALNYRRVKHPQATFLLKLSDHADVNAE